MPTYLYYCEVHKEFETVHSITEVLEDCPKCKEEGLPPQKLKKLIAGSTNFILTGGGWANTGYS